MLKFRYYKYGKQKNTPLGLYGERAVGSNNGQSWSRRTMIFIVFPLIENPK